MSIEHKAYIIRRTREHVEYGCQVCGWGITVGEDTLEVHSFGNPRASHNLGPVPIKPMEKVPEPFRKHLERLG